MTQRIDINGAPLVYAMAGAGHPRTIVTLHGGRGFGDHRSDFRAYGPLADSFRLVSYDQRGHGGSSRNGPLTFDQLVDDLEGVRLTLGRDRPMVLIGGSFGGMIALCYALKYPQGLSHLVLRGTAPSHHHEAEARRHFLARLPRAPMATPAMLDKLLSDRIIDDDEFRLIWFALMPIYEDKVDLDAALERARTAQLSAAVHNALFAVKDYDLRDRLPEIRVPTFVFCGAEDWICPASQSALIAEAIPGARLLTVPGCNHYVHHEANDLVLGELRRFLA